VTRTARLVTLLLLGACDGRAPVPSPAERWQRAQELWLRGDPGAFRAWATFDASTDEGRTARRRLVEADAIYRRGVVLLAARDPSAAEVLRDGKAVAPIDPALYLSLARACRDRGYPERAAGFYRKSIAAAGPDRALAEAELRALDPGFADPFDPPGPDRAASDRGATDRAAIDRAAITDAPSWRAPVAAGAALLLVAAALLLWRRAPRRSLAALAAERPELHPAISYLVGCMRHELLKHRIGAVAGAVEALHRGDATDEQQRFLRARLVGSEPLLAAWRDHLRTFDRALGPRFSVERSDPAFRDAGRAIAAIARLAQELGRLEPRDLERLARAHARLRAFDRGLAAFSTGLSRTTLDEALLREAVAGVREEYAAAQVALDELSVGRVPPGITVDVYRVDLLVILKNLVRNAVLAVGRGAAPRRVAIDVVVDMEPTGEESVRVRVRDTSPEPLDLEAAWDRRAARGLGIVTAALDRYDGAIDVGPVGAAGDGFAKAVTVRLFRALDDTPATVGAAA
jgi:hypothetical protein